MSDTERDDVLRAAGGDLQAFERIVKAWSDRIQAAAARILGDREDARDAAQEVFVKLYRFLGRYDPRRPFEPWLYKIAVNVCYDYARKRRRQSNEVPLDDVINTELPRTEPTGIAAGDTHEKVMQMTDQLTLGQKTAFVLRDVEGFTSSEVAEIMDCTQATVRTHLHRARARLRELIRRHYPELIEGRHHEMP
jgi:RNA polymerase sigma-70 factor (ECF subfamily)